MPLNGTKTKPEMTEEDPERLHLSIQETADEQNLNLGGNLMKMCHLRVCVYWKKGILPYYAFNKLLITQLWMSGK